MIRDLTTDAEKWLRTQTPKDYVQMIAAASEALRRVTPMPTKGASKPGGKGEAPGKTDLLAEFRAVMNGAVEN